MPAIWGTTVETVERSPSRTASLGEEGIGLGPDAPRRPRLDLHPASEAGDGSVLVELLPAVAILVPRPQQDDDLDGDRPFFCGGCMADRPLIGLDHLLHSWPVC